MLKENHIAPDAITTSITDKKLKQNLTMSTECAPWIFSLDGVECRICGHSIKPLYVAEDPKLSTPCMLSDLCRHNQGNYLTSIKTASPCKL